MLEGQNLFFRHSSKSPWILEDLNILLQPGKVIGIFGPSGCGKSTLAQILAGYLKPQCGCITIDHHPLPTKGYCPVQLLFQHPELTVNPSWKVKHIINEAYAPASDLLQALEISPQWMERHPHELSGGEIQRLAIARALSPHTRYLIADEMTAMLDAKTQAHIWHTVLEHCRLHGIGILAISHDRPLLACICNHVMEISSKKRLAQK